MVPELVEHLWWFISERHAVWQRRSTGAPPPWSDDAYLQQYHFTNIFRELDRGTQFLRSILAANVSGLEDQVYWITAYRLVNRIETVREEGFPVRTIEGARAWCEQLRVRQRTKKAVGSVAHFTKVVDLERALPVLAAPNRVVERVASSESAFAVSRAIQGVNGIGPFFGVQIAADLVGSRGGGENAPLAHLRGTTCDLAVGSRLAVKCLATGALPEHDRKARYPAEWELEVFNELCALSWLEPVELEHALCEWWRYRWLLASGGKGARRYRGGVAT